LPFDKEDHVYHLRPSAEACRSNPCPEIERGDSLALSLNRGIVNPVELTQFNQCLLAERP
jgi:hypothetical protein